MKALKIGDLNIPVPIIQGGMGVGISLSGLASAVANMGGVGVIATVAIGVVSDVPYTTYNESSIVALRHEIRKARSLSKGVIAVNIMNVLTNFSDMVKTSIEEGIDIIFSGAGLPLDLPKYIGEGIKTKLVPIVSSGRAASILCSKWMSNFNYLPDALVVEGPKAGGHLGFKPKDIEKPEMELENLLAEVLEVTKEVKEKYDKDIPVIAAGGIYTGEDIYDIIEKGASAVQLGTRFVGTHECDADIEFKNTFINSNEEDIEIIKSPVGLPGRSFSNKFIKDSEAGLNRPKGCKYNCIKSCNPKTTSFCISDALIAAFEGRIEDGFVFTGSNGYRIDKITSVEQIFNELTEEYAKAEKSNS